LLLYKAILEPIWTCGVQLWSTAANSNIEIIQRFQNKYLRIIVDASWYVINDTLYHDLNVPYVRDVIKKLSQKYTDRMEEYPKEFAPTIEEYSPSENNLEFNRARCTGCSAAVDRK